LRSTRYWIHTHRTHRVLAPLLSALLFGIAACGGSTPTSTASPSASPVPENALTVAGPAGSSGAAFKSLLLAWGAANGVTVTYIEGTSASSFAKIQAQAQAGQMQIDILNNNDQTTALGRAQGIWAPINFKIFDKTNIDTGYAFPKDVMGDPPVGVRIFVISSGIAYNQDVFTKNGWPAPTSWLDLVNPTYAKCLAPLDPTVGVPWIPMMNYVTTGDWNNATKTFTALKAVAKSIPSWTNTNPGAIQLTVKGTACMTPTSQGRYVEGAVNNPQLKFVIPKEGMPMYGGTLAITKLAPHPIAAQMAVNMLLRAEAGQKLLEVGFYPSTNTKVTRATTGPAAGIPVASEFKSLNIHQVPISVYDHVDDWLHQYQSLASGS
jgi:putative spermidine/putrescine transport system substrate-binding protein